jgi:lysozyme
VPFGLYHFFRPGGDLNDADRQAVHFLSVDHTLAELPPVLDLELEPLNIVNAERWLSTVQTGLSVAPIIYGSPAFLSKHFEAWDGVSTYPLWVAEYTLRPQPLTGPWKTWDFWQHSNSGTVDGISGTVDLNWYNGSADDLRSLLK